MNIVVEKSKNTKLASKNERIAATYLPISLTCSDNCSLKNKVCYAQTGYVGFTNRRLEKKLKRKTHDQIIGLEADQIRNSFKKNNIKDVPLRLHVSGDCRTVKGATRLASAAQNYLDRGGGRVYTYTHSWRTLKRKRWGKISVLASIENPKETIQARKNGYASALVLKEFPSDKAFYLEGEKFVPCPNQTLDITCSNCRLCFNSNGLYNTKTNIAFAAHSIRKNNLIQISKKDKLGSNHVG